MLDFIAHYSQAKKLHAVVVGESLAILVIILSSYILLPFSFLLTFLRKEFLF